MPNRERNSCVTKALSVSRLEAHFGPGLVLSISCDGVKDNAIGT